ncbi:hypothetical protein KY284_019600 [Solanum tuberosum]|nr:hypothetical protein KY284_019600 [Solanum tuberosum]
MFLNALLIGLVQYEGGGGNNVDLARWPVIGPPFGGGGDGGFGLFWAGTASTSQWRLYTFVKKATALGLKI